MNTKIAIISVSLLIIIGTCFLSNNKGSDIFTSGRLSQLYSPVPAGVQTRWISPENPSGEKGKGGMTNKGAKGNAFYIVQPGETKVLMDVRGSGIIQRIWVSGTIAKNAEQRRAVRIDMYWDGAKKPAVSAPVGDFFGIAHGLIRSFESDLFLSPEGRSFNCQIPMPYKKSAYISITNESSSEVWIWYDINYLEIPDLADDLLYFHAFWNRDLKTRLGVDYTILPGVEGKGRYIGTNIGVLGNPDYNGTWFGEGEVKIYLDGDNELPTLVQTGTEDYIGTGWGQGEFSNRYVGSPVSDRQHDIYAFYRFHLKDNVYFHSDCRVTIQQMGSSNKPDILRRDAEGAELIPVWFLDTRGEITVQRRLLEPGGDKIWNEPDVPITGTNYYRRDDVCATAYFYLDRPESILPALPGIDLRLKDLKTRVYDNIDSQ